MDLIEVSKPPVLSKLSAELMLLDRFCLDLELFLDELVLELPRRSRARRGFILRLCEADFLPSMEDRGWFLLVAVSRVTSSRDLLQ